jgi:hypothetical protein
MVSSKCTLIISFHEGCSAGKGLEAVFFIVGFFVVAGFLAAVVFLVVLGLDLERAGDFFPTAVSGAGEARGDGRGEDITWRLWIGMTVTWAGKVGKSVERPKAARLYIRRHGTERVASRVRSLWIVDCANFISTHSHPAFPGIQIPTDQMRCATQPCQLRGPIQF